MDLRLRNSTDVDLRTVQLPHGTEVSTRVERTTPERTIPAGAVGRVVLVHENGSVDVALVGIGTVRYARDELVPRKAGQVAFAVEREASWNALHGCRVLETVVGSRAWGLSHEGSDTDVRGAFALPFAWTVGLAAPPLDLVSRDGSTTYWETTKLVRQALRADPNTLETLFVPSARALDPIGAWLLEARDAFVSTEIHGTFGRYAISQLKKLEASLHLAESRALVLEWMREEPSPPLDELASRLAAVSTRSAPREGDRIAMARMYLKQLYRSMYDQGMIRANDLDALRAFARSPHAKTLDLPRELRPKNAYNLVRLLDTAIVWLETGEPVFTVREPLRSTLLAIKHGEVALREVTRLAEEMVPRLETARVRSPLPTRPDVARADALVRAIGREVARRAVENAPGPWGTDAPAPPTVRWGDAGENADT